MKFTRFRVQNYRNIANTDWIRVGEVTAFVGQNEAGKSNLFEALYKVNPFESAAAYDLDEDWPGDRWEDKAQGAKALVCEAEFVLDDAGEIETLFAHAATPLAAATSTTGEPIVLPARPSKLVVIASRSYGSPPAIRIENPPPEVRTLDSAKVTAWLTAQLPKFVYVREYDIDGSATELNDLHNRHQQQGWNGLSPSDQMILTILDLAKINIPDLIQKGGSAAGRTVRAFDTVNASSFLTKQYKELWRQKEVEFNIDIDATTLNIFVKDTGLDMPVRLKNRSTGFRWHVAFAWKFTHASRGRFKNCVLLLEEPGIHLHYSGQQDLLRVFERLATDNVILYTTHLASMVDQGFPERVRIVESKDHHAQIIEGIVSSDRAPMAVIETRLGLAGDLGGLLGNRSTLIVEGGVDALVMTKLSAVLKSSGKAGLSDQIYLWPADGAPKTPMYAGFAIGQKWHSAVLLDTDEEGKKAKAKISDLYLKGMAEASGVPFKILMLGTAAKISKTDAAIEDLFPDDFYIDCCNIAYGVLIKSTDLPTDGSAMISKRVERVLVARGIVDAKKGLDKTRVMRAMLSHFDKWKKEGDLPPGTSEKAQSLFTAINAAFE